MPAISRVCLALTACSMARALASASNEQAVLSHGTALRGASNAQVVRSHANTALSGASKGQAQEEWSFLSANDEGMAAFLLSIAQDPASAEYFMRVLQPPFDTEPWVTERIIPAGFKRENVLASAGRLLAFGYVSEQDMDAPKGVEENDSDDPALIENVLQQSDSRNDGPQKEVFAPVRSVIAQKIIQQDLFRQLAAANNQAGPRSINAEARTIDLVSHTLLPLIRQAFHSSKKVMSDALNYKKAWADASAALTAAVEAEEKRKEAEETKRFEQQQNQKQDLIKVVDNNKQTQLKFADVTLLEAAEAEASNNNVEAAANVASEVTSAVSSDEDREQAELHRQMDQMQSSVASLSAFMELDRDWSSGGTASNERSGATADNGAAADMDAYAYLDKLQPVSAAIGEKAITDVLNAFFTLLENPEFNFLRDVFAFDADSFCYPGVEEERKNNLREPMPASQQCGREQKRNVARLFGLHAFRIIHMAAEGALVRGSELEKMIMEHERTENELLAPREPHEDGIDNNGGFQGLVRSEAQVDLTDLPKNAMASKRSPSRDDDEDPQNNDDLEGDSQSLVPARRKKTLIDYAGRRRRSSSSVGSDSKVDINNSNDVVVERRDRGEALGDLVDLQFFITGRIKEENDVKQVTTADSKLQKLPEEDPFFLLPVERSVLDPIMAEEWKIDSRIFFAIQALLLRIDDPCQLGSMADLLPSLYDDKARRDAVLEQQSQPIVINGQTAPLKPANGQPSTKPMGGQASSNAAQSQLAMAMGDNVHGSKTGHGKRNGYFLLLEKIGLVTGGFPPLNRVGSPTKDVSGYAFTFGYREQLIAINERLQEVLFGNNYSPKMPQDRVAATKFILAPRRLDVFFATIQGQITRRRAGFHAPSAANWQNLLSGKALVPQSSPDEIYFQKLRADVSLLSRVILLAQMGAEQSLRGLADDANAVVKAETLRPPQVLLAAAQMAFDADGWDKVYMASTGPVIEKYAEHAKLLMWDDRDLQATATGISYNSKTTRILSYSTIDAILMPPPLNPSTRDKKLPSDPALAAAESRMADGKLCAAVLGFTNKHLNGRVENEVFGRPDGFVFKTNNAQVVPEPNESRRYYIFCTRSRASEPAFAEQAKKLATTVCAASHNAGLGMQLQTEEWYRFQQSTISYRQSEAKNKADFEARKKAAAAAAKKNSSKKGAVVVEEPEDNFQPLDLPDPVAIAIKAGSQLPVFYDTKAQPANQPGPLIPRYEPSILDCSYLIQEAVKQKKAVIATNKNEADEDPVPVLPKQQMAPVSGQHQQPLLLPGDKSDPAKQQRAEIFNKIQQDRLEKQAKGQLGIDAGMPKTNKADRLSNAEAPSQPISYGRPVPLDLAFVDPVVVASRKSRVDARFVAYASRFVNRLHRHQVAEWVIERRRKWDHPSHDIARLKEAKGGLTLWQMQHYSNFAQMVAGRQVQLALGPEYPLLFTCASRAMTAPNGRSSQITSDDSKTKMLYSPEHSNPWTATYYDNDERIVVMSFASLNGAGGDRRAAIMLSMGSTWTKRYSESSKMVKKVQAQFKGFSIFLTGFSYGGLMASTFSKQYGLRAYSFSPAPLPKSGFFGRALLAGIIRLVVAIPLVPIRGLQKITGDFIPMPRLGNSWLHVALPRNINGLGSFAEGLSSLAKTKVVRGNGLITITSVAGDWASAAYYREKDIGGKKNGRGYDLIVIPAMLRRSMREVHDLAQFAALPIACDYCTPNKPKPLPGSGVRQTIPTTTFTRFGEKGQVDSYSITVDNVLTWLKEYEAIVPGMVHDVGFVLDAQQPQRGGKQETSFYPPKVEQRDEGAVSGLGWII